MGVALIPATHAKFKLVTQCPMCFGGFSLGIPYRTGWTCCLIFLLAIRSKSHYFLINLLKIRLPNINRRTPVSTSTLTFMLVFTTLTNWKSLGEPVRNKEIP